MICKVEHTKSMSADWYGGISSLMEFKIQVYF